MMTHPRYIAGTVISKIGWKVMREALVSMIPLEMKRYTDLEAGEAARCHSGKVDDEDNVGLPGPSVSHLLLCI